jgi:hypothetical protein
MIIDDADSQICWCFSVQPTAAHHTGAENNPTRGINETGAAKMANGR